jgi:rod shape determining protein RodA
MYWIGLGLAVFVLMAWVDYHEIARLAYPAYAVTLLLLILVLLVGRVGLGAKRWLSLGSFSIQPSELAKLALLLVLARYFSENSPRRGLSFGQLIVPGILTTLPVLLILKQPDLGTALALSSVFITLVFLMGLRSRFLIHSTLLVLMLLPFLWHFFWTHLKDYQKERLLTFLEPGSDPMGTGYHIIQSKIAIGSGGLLGKGLFGGTQSQLKFLPESHTDFIFAVFAEEWGFLGVLILLGLFVMIVLWGVEIAYRAKDPLGTLIAAGIVGLLSFVIVVNIGMTLGVMPVVGVPLPLMSYGGTSMITTLGLLGLLLNVKLRRFMLFY